MKVQKKLMAIYAIAVLGPILIVGIYLTQLMCDMVVDRAISEASVNIDRIKERLNETIRIANALSDRIYIDEKVIEILTTKYESYGEVVKVYNEAETINSYLKYYDEIASIRIYTENDTLLNNSQFMKPTDQIRKESWYKEAISRNGRIEWSYRYDETAGKHYLSLIRALRNSQEGLLGVMVININTEKLKTIIKDEPYDTLIAFNQQVISTQGNSELIEDKLGELRELELESVGNYKMQLKNKEGTHYIIFNTFRPAKAQMTTVEICMNMSVRSVTSKTMEIITTSFIIILCTTIISTMLILVFSKSFANRIILVRREMHKVVSGNFNIRKSIEGNDEIGELYRDIYGTVESVKALSKQIYEEKVQKEEIKRRQKEMQFAMLASQINPHFLYNTLETIRMKAYCTGQIELANVVKMLSKLLRRNLEVTDRRVSLQSELDLIKAYLEIQKFRFGERITYEIKCEEDISNQTILPLILQPIVENAFIHGLEGKYGDGKITCSIEEEHEEIVITIEDDGLGIEEERLEELHQSLQGDKETIKGSFGFNNINQRLKLYYGEKYGIKITSKMGQGTKVTVTLPKA